MYVDFQNFIIKEQAEEVAKILNDNDINVIVKEVKPNVDITFSNTHSLNYWIRIPKGQVKLAESILNKGTNSIKVPEGHYFLEFTDDELTEVVKNYYDWNKTDYQYARILLDERGIKYSEEKIAEFKNASLEELRAPENGKSSWIIAGFITAFMGGLLGVIMGWNYWTEIKTLPNGEKVHRFNAPTRQKGKLMMIIGLVVIVLAITGRILTL
ncbi:hypothetical protein [Carboxylicivirga sp. RSCT41]|uniref:hypothetical protein n=1 Tax=Carboxylicivirga agarovorans TaxID=3417570 RepID=UPI003D32C569